MYPCKTVVTSSGYLVERIALVFGLIGHIVTQLFDFHLDVHRVHADVLFCRSEFPRPPPGASEHLFVKFLDEFERQDVFPHTRKCPAFSFENVFLFPRVQLTTVNNVLRDQTLRFIRIEGGSAGECSQGLIPQLFGTALQQFFDQALELQFLFAPLYSLGFQLHRMRNTAELLFGDHACAVAPNLS